MIGWLIALCAVACLLMLPVGVLLYYDLNGGRAVLAIGPIRYNLYPKSQKKKTKASTNQKFEETKTGTKSDGGSITDFLPLLRILMDLLRDFRRKLCVSELDFRLVLANRDPSDLAVQYGQAWAVVGNLFPLLENTFTIRKRNVDIACDFCADKTRVTAKAHLNLSVADVLWLAGKYGIQAIKKYFKIMNNRKGGAVS